VRTEAEQKGKRDTANAQGQPPSPEAAALAARVEDVVRALRSVIYVKTEVERGQVKEIHVSADARRNFKQLARDIQSAVFSQLGLRVDHRVISIAPVESSAGRPMGARLQLTNIAFQVESRTAQARVTLTRQGDSYVGHASAPAYDFEEARLVAEATINALEEFLQSSLEAEAEKPALSLKDVRVDRDGGGGATISAWVRMVREKDEELLLGCVPAGRDMWHAAARATLDAVNRRLGWYVE
jgi:hypothetical protein